jgi:lysozyme
MRLSGRGLKAIAGHEGFVAKVYLDFAGHKTIGYGHKLRAHESFPDPLTKAQALALLEKDVEIAERNVNALVKPRLTQSQFDALVSIVFNVGGGAFARSKMLIKLNKQDFEGAASEFDDWNKYRKDGELVPSETLTKRRAAEKAMFLEKDLDRC